MPELIVAAGLAFALSLVLTHRVRAWADRAGILDFPDGTRHGPRQPVPRAGGIAIFLTLVTVLSLAFVVSLDAVQVPADQLDRLAALTLGATAIFALGLWDDVRSLRPRTKFLVQVIVALAMFWGGIRFQSVGFLGEGRLEFPLWVAIPVTVVWIVGITNAFNLIDGADGVAAGAALFALVTMTVVSVVMGNQLSALVCLVLAGATLGFLVYNFPPASIFLGDSGSLLLGFILATLGVITTQKAPTAVAVAAPVVVFGLPILDTTLAILRRFLRRQHPFRGDRHHIHHRLRDLGHSPRTVALLLYAVSGAFSLVALLMMSTSGAAVAAILAITGAIVLLGVQRLRLPELVEAHGAVRRGMRRGLQQRHVIAQNVRVREAVERMEEAVDPLAVFTALGYAFGASEFERVEAFLPAARGAALKGVQGVEIRGSAVVWRWQPEPPRTGESLWEIRLPFRDGRRHPVGRLSLWRSIEDDHVLTDLRMVALELLPAMYEALDRMAGERPRRPERTEVLAEGGSD
ncbi:MAG: undecaprenyl/decaprenyl-phosphate alpha-N-acetylglucosaminyl 1-phosphate transferase [Gemmatimonadetes bacterium]|nr:undecaprenyl/decaprenyl-phosphate alpha-N-acetylglucosaminyl 1-phosphate transferase [Gemmatimonadota bacterium]